MKAAVQCFRVMQFTPASGWWVVFENPDAGGEWWARVVGFALVECWYARDLELVPGPEAEIDREVRPFYEIEGELVDARLDPNYLRLDHDGGTWKEIAANAVKR